jgi:hypothetical protein
MNILLKTILVGALATTAHTTWALDAQQIFERVSPSVVVIKAGDSMGSGVVYALDNSGLTPSTTILTNCHVVKGYTQVTVERLGKKASATVKICDVERDMAVITLGGVLPTLTVRTTPLKVGEPAFAVGAPQGLELSISQGIVSQLRPTPLGIDPVIQTTAAISQGSSGGGLFDSEGRLIGLTTLYYNESQSLNFAVPVSFIWVLQHTSAASSATKLGNNSSNSNKRCGWIKLGETTGFSHYIDYCKINGSDRYKFAWTIHDHKEIQRSRDNKYTYLSTESRSVYDCQLLRSATTAVFYYQSKMGQGALMDSFSVSEKDWNFKDSPTESAGAKKIESVCK